MIVVIDNTWKLEIRMVQNRIIAVCSSCGDTLPMDGLHRKAAETGGFYCSDTCLETDVALKVAIRSNP